MYIIIKKNNHQNFRILVQPNATIKHVKQNAGIPSHDSLSYNGETLHDEKHLQHYGIQENSVLYQVTLTSQINDNFLSPERNNYDIYESIDHALPPLSDFYQGKTLFCTGCTGFVGKVLLEKLLRVLGHKIEKIYVLVRPKKNITPQERLKKEIVNSDIFHRIRSEMFGISSPLFSKKENDFQMSPKEKAFQDFMFSKLEAVPGDVAQPELFQNMSQESIEKLRNEIQLIYHSAATVDFQARLDEAIQLNAFGPLRMLEFAKSCSNIEGFCHVSTAFTNGNIPSGSLLMEKFYPLGIPPQFMPSKHGEKCNDSSKNNMMRFCERVLKMNDPEEIQKLSKSLLKHFGFPNTYTFTKNMGEKFVDQYHDHVPVSIVRPTIVGSSYDEPMKGWIDAISAVASVYFFLGLGMLNTLQGNGTKVSDQIPVDYVVNNMITCLPSVIYENNNLNAKSSSNNRQSRKSALRIFHSSTSSVNPITWSKAFKISEHYWITNQPKKGIAKADFKLNYSRLALKTQWLISYQSLSQMFRLLAHLTKNEYYIKMAKKTAKLESRAIQLSTLYKHFTTNDWIFNDDNVRRTMQKLHPKDRATFYLDTSEINWEEYISSFNHGLHKFIMKEKPQIPCTKVDTCNMDCHDWFSDIRFVFKSKSCFNVGKSKSEMKKLVLSSRQVQQHLHEPNESKKEHDIFKVRKRALSVMDEIFADPNMNAVKSLCYAFRKLWRNNFSSVLIDSKTIECKLRKLSQSSGGKDPVILVPNHNGYMPILILIKIMFSWNLPLPLIRMDEVFFNQSPIKTFLRQIGGFIDKSNNDKMVENQLNRVLYHQYVQQLLKDGEWILDPLPDGRNENIIENSNVIDCALEAMRNNTVQNVNILPVSITSEKDFLKGEHVSERDVFANHYGDINVSFGDPIPLSFYAKSLKSKRQDYSPSNQQIMKNVIEETERNLVIMPTHLIATIFLSHRFGITISELSQKILQLKKHVEKRGKQVHWPQNYCDEDSSQKIVTKSIKLMKNLVTISNNVIIGKNSNQGNETIKIMESLHQYKQYIIQILAPESIVCSALNKLLSHSSNITRKELIHETSFLYNLLKDVLNLESIDFDHIIDLLIDDNILSIKKNYKDKSEANEENIDFNSNNSEMRQVFCDLITPLLETHCIVVSTLNSLVNNPMEEISFVHKIQWIANRLLNETYGIQLEESGSSLLVKTVISSLVERKMIERKTQQLLHKGIGNRDHVIQVVSPYDDSKYLSALVTKLKNYIITQENLIMRNIKNNMNQDSPLVLSRM